MSTYGPSNVAMQPIYVQIVLSCVGNFVFVIMQEKKLVAEIKKTAKTGNEVSLLVS